MSTKIKADHESASEDTEAFQGNLSVTSLYTAGVWSWAKMEGASLVSNVDTDRVFGATNAALAVMRLFRWGLPRLPEGLAQRHVLIDQLTEEADHDLIIELAAGLSMRGWRVMRAKGDASRLRRYIEIDLPHVMTHKMKALLEEALPKGLILEARDLKLLNQNDIEELLEDSETPLIIAEGLVMYLSHSELEEIISLLGPELEARGGRLIFDWVPTIEQPRPGLIGRVLGALIRLFTGGETFKRDERSREDVRELLLSNGASRVQLIDTDQVAESRELPFPKAKTQQLIFYADFSRGARSLSEEP